MVRFPPWAWVTFAVVLLGLLAVDMACHRGARCDSPRRAAMWSAMWIAVGLAFAVFVQIVCCQEAAVDYLAAYLIEKSLSLDNLFVFLVVFRSLSIPEACQRTALTWGVLGALVLRGAFIGAGAAAVQRFDAVTFVFGGLLLVAAWRSLQHAPAAAGRRNHDPTRPDGPEVRPARRACLADRAAARRLLLAVALERHRALRRDLDGPRGAGRRAHGRGPARPGHRRDHLPAQDAGAPPAGHRDRADLLRGRHPA